MRLEARLCAPSRCGRGGGAPARPPSACLPGRAAPAAAPQALPRRASASPLPTRERKVESHQVGPEPHLNVVHDRGLRHRDLWRRQAGGGRPAARRGRQNTGHVNGQSNPNATKTKTDTEQNTLAQQAGRAAARAKGEGGSGGSKQQGSGWQGGGTVRVLNWVTFCARPGRTGRGGRVAAGPGGVRWSGRCWVECCARRRAFLGGRPTEGQSFPATNRPKARALTAKRTKGLWLSFCRVRGKIPKQPECSGLLSGRPFLPPSELSEPQHRRKAPRRAGQRWRGSGGQGDRAPEPRRDPRSAWATSAKGLKLSLARKS